MRRGRARRGRGCFAAGTRCAVRCATRRVPLPIHSHVGKLSGNKMHLRFMCFAHRTLQPVAAPSIQPLPGRGVGPSRRERREAQGRTGSAAGAPVVPPPQSHKSPGRGGREGRSEHGHGGLPGRLQGQFPIFSCKPWHATLRFSLFLFPSPPPFNSPPYLLFFFFRWFNPRSAAAGRSSSPCHTCPNAASHPSSGAMRGWLRPAAAGGGRAGGTPPTHTHPRHLPAYGNGLLGGGCTARVRQAAFTVKLGNRGKKKRGGGEAP